MRQKDIKELRRLLDAAGPRPWRFNVKGIDGYVVNMKGTSLFGGASSEGYVDENTPAAAAIVKVSEHIDELLKIAKRHLSQKKEKSCTAGTLLKAAKEIDKLPKAVREYGRKVLKIAADVRRHK